MPTLLGIPLVNANTGAVTTTIYPTQYGGLAAQNASGNYSPTGIFGGAAGGAGGAAQVNTIYGQAYTTPAGYNSYGLPMMSGVLHTTAFTDANGNTWAITIDQAYAQILQDISRSLQMTYGNQQVQCAAPLLKMLDGDFSEEEMTEAEGIIAELEGRHGPEAPHP